MFTQDFFAKYKLTPDDLKVKLTKVPGQMSGKGKDTQAEQLSVSGISPAGTTATPRGEGALSGLVHRINNRIRDGITRNLTDSKIYWAIDKAYDTGFQQVTPTLVESIMDRKFDEDKVLSAMNEWGLGHLITPAPCTCNSTPCSCSSKEKKVLNIPAFFRVFIPLVKAYVTIRWSKIFTDRNVTPLLKYEPLKSTQLNRIRTEIITDRVQMMSTQLGYSHTMRQEIFQALLYSFALSFPKEGWYKETVEYVDGEKSEKKIVREGIRYNTPHPSRVFMDPSEPPSSFNTDSGASFAFYWTIIPWRNVRTSKHYWNKDMVSFGENWINRSPTYFEEIFPCSLRFPSPTTNPKNLEGASTTHQPRLRDEQLESFYTSEEDDKAVVLTEYFEKLNPSENGLGDYDGELWFRFVVAGDDTIIYCEPIPYSPVIFTGYDTDENRSKNASLALEIMPFQDQMGNLLSQYILSVKQNLDKVVFYNTDVVDESSIKQLRNMGEKRFRAPVYIPFSLREQANFGQTGPQNAFLSPDLPPQNTGEIAQSITAILNILERILALSAQELGQAATHEQTAQESIIIANNVSTRLGFTASFVDDAAHARKCQLYSALMAYGSEEMYAQIERDQQINATMLEKIGFKAVPDNEADTETDFKSDEDGTIVVKGKKKGLILDGFVSNREGENRMNGPQIAAALANFVAAFSNSSSVLLQILGPDQTVKLFNQMASIAGFPKDFRLKPNPEMLQQGAASPEWQEQVAEAIRNSQASTIEEVSKAIIPLREAFTSLQTNDENQNKAIADVLAQLNNFTSANALPTPTPNDNLQGISAPPGITG